MLLRQDWERRSIDFEVTKYNRFGFCYTSVNREKMGVQQEVTNWFYGHWEGSENCGFCENKSSMGKFSRDEWIQST